MSEGVRGLGGGSRGGAGRIDIGDNIDGRGVRDRGAVGDADRAGNVGSVGDDDFVRVYVHIAADAAGQLHGVRRDIRAAADGAAHGDGVARGEHIARGTTGDNDSVAGEENVIFRRTEKFGGAARGHHILALASRADVIARGEKYAVHVGAAVHILPRDEQGAVIAAVRPVKGEDVCIRRERGDRERGHEHEREHQRERKSQILFHSSFLHI